MVYEELAKDTKLSDCSSCLHLQKMHGAKNIKDLETFLAVWDNLVLVFPTLPKRFISQACKIGNS